MVKISILYPKGENLRFDLCYYVEKHIPLSLKLVGQHPGFIGVSVEHGVAGVKPHSAATFVVCCHFLFDSIDDFRQAFMPYAAILQGEFANYTDITPIIQVSEVLDLRAAYRAAEAA